MSETHLPIGEAQPASAPQAPTRAQAFRYWWKLGWISFGGPAGQIAIMHHDLVDRLHWISERRFLHALNYCMILPGPEAQQLATYIGWLMHRTWGGIVAGGLFVLPSLFVLIGLSWLYMAYGELPAVSGVLYGIKPAVTAIVLHAAWRIGSRTLKSNPLRIIAVLAFVAIFAFSVPFPLIVLAAAAIGAIGGKLAPAGFAGTGSHGIEAMASAPAVIDDTTPTPEHAQFRPARLAAVVAVGMLLWGSTLGALALVFGAGNTLTEMGWFFTKAALLTFGGAYAVLPYVYQGAVQTFAWLTPVQMIDGLALGESTPGPLIMVVAFVGFVGGWSGHLLGIHLFLAGALAAATVTWFTFLPSFVFILAGGPFIESTHGQVRFTAPLTGVTAAVVGVIVNLAAFFAYHVLWPTGMGGSFDVTAALLGVLAIIALFRLKLRVIPVLALSGAAGLLLSLVRG
jgi:chromate transporter